MGGNFFFGLNQWLKSIIFTVTINDNLGGQRSPAADAGMNLYFVTWVSTWDWISLACSIYNYFEYIFLEL